MPYRLANRHIAKLDRMNIAQVQHNTLMSHIRIALDTKFGRTQTPRRSY